MRNTRAGLWTNRFSVCERKLRKIKITETVNNGIGCERPLWKSAGKDGGARGRVTRAGRAAAVT